MAEKKSVVVIGGGTGTHTILRGLKHFDDVLDITAVVTMADSGGSTGRLRDEFGMLPVGDARMAISALADDTEGDELLMRDLFLYRFQNGNGLKGHNLGNLLLTALSDMLGGEAEAIAAASSILRISGTVLPVTTDNTHLVAKYDDGVVVEGEHIIDDPSPDRHGRHIVELSLKPQATINPQVAESLSVADLIIIGPGDLYSSLLANCVVAGMDKAIKKSSAKLVYIGNLMERLGQTQNMTLSDCVSEIERYIHRAPDIVLVNNATLPEEAVERYRNTEGTKPVVDDLNIRSNIHIIRTDLLSELIVNQQSSDAVKRSLIRHDSDKLARAIIKLIKQYT